MKGYDVIDADGHVAETTQAGWGPIRYLPARFHDQAPQYVGVIENSIRFRLEGELYPRVGGRVFVATDPGERTLAYCIERFGPGPFVYASDSWHWDGGFPETVNEVVGRDDLTPRQKAAVLGGNAARLFGLPIPAGV